MKSLSEKTYHQLFNIGVALKAIISFFEIIAGLLFCFVTYETLRGIAFELFGGELREDPRDLIWHYSAMAFHHLSVTPESVWAFIFLSHGIVKIFLILFLWRDQLWAYPASAVAFSFFVLYQFYELFYTPSIFLWLITIFDIALIVLIAHEYIEKKKLIFSGKNNLVP